MKKKNHTHQEKFNKKELPESNNLSIKDAQAKLIKNKDGIIFLFIVHDSYPFNPTKFL